MGVTTDLDVVDVYVLTPQQAKALALADVRHARRHVDRAKDALQRKRGNLHAQIRAAWAAGATQGELLAAAGGSKSMLETILAKGE